MTSQNHSLLKRPEAEDFMLEKLSMLTLITAKTNDEHRIQMKIVMLRHQQEKG